MVDQTLSAIVATGRRARAVPCLYVGMAGDAPRTAAMRVSLAGIDRVEIGRRERREATRPGGGALALGLPDARMSSAHARLVRQPGGWTVEDVGSKNGTWLGTRRITRGSLGDGDVIVVGHTALVFAETGGEQADAEAGDALAGTATLDPALAARMDELASAARSAVPIEIVGETGTGKELIARAVHAQSKRTGGFVAVNCGALPGSLLEGELFGHRKGAYTGAADDRIGLVRSADGGTLFLDEIAELPAASQAALLRVLQEGEVVPLGADRPVKVDVRIVTATHKPLDGEVAANRFRADLRARLIGLTFELPPLRERRADLAAIVAALLARVAPDRALAFSADAVMAIYAYDWPLNIRELERYLGAAAALARDRIELHQLPPALRECFQTAHVDPDALSPEERELRERLVAAVTRHDGNLAAVARELGKDRTQIRRWMRRFGLER
ncbi:MAG TPA: sigma 54-interacting transcriptional regulator [Kofleriaceae bacterium]|nr:sigma 54-interacting transcriptional regulator [Kofleriaceae bacterium]